MNGRMQVYSARQQRLGFPATNSELAISVPPITSDNRFILLFSAACIALLGLGMVGAGAWDLEMIREAGNWATAPGIIDNSYVTRDTGRRSRGYGYHIRYHFSAHGRTWSGDRLTANGCTPASVSSVASFLHVYAKGKDCTVRFDPADASRNCLQPGEPRDSWILVCLGLFFLAIAGLPLYRAFAMPPRK